VEDVRRPEQAARFPFPQSQGNVRQSEDQKTVDKFFFFFFFSLSVKHLLY